MLCRHEQTTHIPIVEPKNTFTAYHPGNGMETGLVLPHLSSFPCGVHRARDSVRTASHKSTVSTITQSVNMYGVHTYHTCHVHVHIYLLVTDWEKHAYGQLCEAFLAFAGILCTWVLNISLQGKIQTASTNKFEATTQ